MDKWLNLNPKKRQHTNKGKLLQGQIGVPNKRKKSTQTKKKSTFLANQTTKRQE